MKIFYTFGDRIHFEFNRTGVLKIGLNSLFGPFMYDDEKWTTIL
jgi:hypothetical protein